MVKKKLFYVLPEVIFSGLVLGCQMMTTSASFGVQELGEDNSNAGDFFN